MGVEEGKTAISSDVNVGIVVPTLGERSGFLLECVDSIRKSGDAYLVLVRPSGCEVPSQVQSMVNLEVDDPGHGLAAAINRGLQAMPDHVTFVSWLGDDDRLAGATFTDLVIAANASNAAAVFGRCRYIDGRGEEIFVNRSGAWTIPLMLFGPQLVPQPGSIVRFSSLKAIGYLNESLKWAFDLEMFLKLRSQVGGLKFVPMIVSEFRWHENSLTVGSRRGSVAEASSVRRNNLPKGLSHLSRAWEPALRILINLSGWLVSKRIKHAR